MKLLLSGLAILLSLPLNSAYAYGSGPSSTSCVKPSFSDFKPAANKYLQDFRAFSFSASSNTALNSIEVNFSAGPIKEHFSAKQLEITPEANGRITVKGKLNQPFQHGFARISVTAHSKPGCIKTDGFLIKVQ